jgi:glucosylceramidase
MSVDLTNDEERREVVRVATISNIDVLPNVAFRRPDGKIVLIVANDRLNASSFTVRHKSRMAVIRLDPGDVGTYIW